jgi:RNA methyltransferase, TrmH family
VKQLTVARDLQRRRARERTGLFVAEGVRSAEELLASPLRVRTVIVAPGLGDTDRGLNLRSMIQTVAPERGFELLHVTDSELATTAGTDSPQGIIAVAEQPERSFEQVDSPRLVLLLDGIQDPGNVGTILRTAKAFGVSATVALPGTVDLWNPKVVRSAMGALFSHHAFHATASTTIDFLREHSIPVWATSATGEPIGKQRALAGGAPGIAIVVGNEGSGVSRDLADASSRTIAIPVHGVESLNVAVATGILLYALTTA